VVTSWDEDAFGPYCETVVHHRVACRVVDRDGVMVRGERGLVKNPAFQVVRDNAQLLRAFAQEFGLTPSARSGIDLHEDRGSEDARGLLS
jgi:P27 family predicted phage terminase small subunit